MALTQVSTNGIKDATIATADIAADAITGAKIADDSVGAEHIEVLDAALQLGDNVKVQFGTGNDFDISFNGTNGWIDCNAGSLYTDAEESHFIRVNGNEDAIKAVHNGAVELYYDNVAKFYTLSNGVQVVGHVVLEDAYQLKLGTGEDLQIYHDGSDSYVKHNGTGNFYVQTSEASVEDLYLQAGNDVYIRVQTGDTAIKAIGDGAVELYYDNAKVFYTTAAGAIVKRPSGGETQFQITGCEGNDAELRLVADDGDDNNDYWRILGDASDPDLWIQNYGSGNWETNINCTADGKVALYYDASKKLETTSSGVAITGNGTFDAAGSNYIRIGSTDAGGATLTLDGDSNGDGSGADYCMIKHDTDGHLKIYADNPANAANIQFYSNSTTERMRIDSAGRVGIGKTPASYHSNNKGIIAGDGGYALYGRGTDTVILSQNHYYDSSDVGKYIADGAGTFYQQVGGVHKFWTAGSGSADGNISLSEKVRIQNGGGISFNGDTSADNALDDYEEGTWTITALNANGATITANRAWYIKVGSMVKISGSFNITDTNGTNTYPARFSLPFSTNISSYYGAHGTVISNSDYSSGDLVCTIENNGAYMIINTANGMTTRSWSQLGVTRIDFDVTYQRT